MQEDRIYSSSIIDLEREDIKNGAVYDIALFSQNS